jgi:MoxR-like ATPase
VEREHKVAKILNADRLRDIQTVVDYIQVDPRIEEYIVDLVVASRDRDRTARAFARYIEYGASTRGTLYLYRCAKVQALFENRTFVIPEDVKAVAYDVLRHRLVLSYEAESEELSSEDVISAILGSVEVP